MVKIQGNDITRGGEKIGWIRGDDIMDEKGIKRGYFKDKSEDIFNRSGTKVGYLDGNYLVSGGRRISLSDIRRDVGGGSYSDVARSAIYLFLGD